MGARFAAVGAEGRDSADGWMGLPLDGRAPGGRGSGGVIGAPRNDGFVGGMAGVTRAGGPEGRPAGDTAGPPVAGVGIVGRGGNNVERGDGVDPEVDPGRDPAGSAAGRSTGGAELRSAAGVVLVGGSWSVVGGTDGAEGADVKGFVVRGESGVGEEACDGSGVGAEDGAAGGIA